MTFFRHALALFTLSALPATAEMGDDGLHKAPWMHQTFLDLREDLAEENAAGQRLMLLVEQRGCIYCRKMHEEVFVLPRSRRRWMRTTSWCSSTCSAISR